ncbi:MAG: winged helix-turn-helix transcriptional regulator [Promethearchaeota archaeon]
MSTSPVISLEIVLDQITNVHAFSCTLIYWQALVRSQTSQITSSFLENSGLFGLWGTASGVLLFICTISIDSQKYQETKRKLSENKNRVIIKETISNNPGITFREIQRTTNLAMGVLQYHIHNLETEETCEIESFKFGKSKHFFVSGLCFSDTEKVWFSIIRNQTIKNLLNYIKIFPNQFSQKDLIHLTGSSKSLMSYYVRVLRQNGIVEVSNHYLQISEDFSQIKQDSFFQKNMISE